MKSNGNLINFLSVDIQFHILQTNPYSKNYYFKNFCYVYQNILMKKQIFKAHNIYVSGTIFFYLPYTKKQLCIQNLHYVYKLHICLYSCNAAADNQQQRLTTASSEIYTCYVFFQMCILAYLHIQLIKQLITYSTTYERQ